MLKESYSFFNPEEHADEIFKYSLTVFYLISFSSFTETSYGHL